MVAFGCALAACAEPPPSAVAPSPPPAPAPVPVMPASTWRDATLSPQVAPTPEDPHVAELATACGALDGAMVAVARRVVAEGGEPDVDRVVAMLRESGSPLMRPRVLIGPSIRAALDSRRLSSPRCGVAVGGGKELAIIVDAQADLEPLPVRSRTGAWLDVRAVLHVPARGARIVVLGARGVPRTVGTTLEGDRVRARFALDRPGPFTVQLVADLESGPRPVLEARVFADVEPTTADETAPGEDLGGDDDRALERMVDAVRRLEQRPALKRDPRLDALARAHVEQLKRAGAVVHDVGDGNFAARFEAEGLRARVVGENVARARSLVLAHRTLHASPSHRLNLLNAQYTHIGLAVTRDDGGRVYVCEVFASPLS